MGTSSEALGPPRRLPVQTPSQTGSHRWTGWLARSTGGARPLPSKESSIPRVGRTCAARGRVGNSGRRCDILPLTSTQRLSKWVGSVKKWSVSAFEKWSKRAQTLTAQILLVSLIFLANICLTIFANLRYPNYGAVGLIYEGSCNEVNALNLWLHVAISILSTLMLSASNYCMQLQVSPTRTNVDEAHRVGRWVDIGLNTLRNMRYVRGWRRISWAILALTSIPINLL